MDPLDIYGNREQLEKAKEKKLQEIKKSIQEKLPHPMDKMLDTSEGTYALIAIAVALFIVFLRLVGMTLKFFSKLVLIVSILAALYFSYLYFYG
ncbi:hypothetical protein [Persephonella sp.]